MQTLKDWKIRSGMFGVSFISGEVYGSKKHIDGKNIHTSAIISVDVEKSTVKTHSGSEYVLEQSSTEYDWDMYYLTPEIKEKYSTITPIQVLNERVDGWLTSQSDYKRLKANKKPLKIKFGDKEIDYDIFRSDVLTKTESGKYVCHTGSCMTDLDITDDEVESLDKLVVLEMM